jgi:hypothetical protein
VCMSITFGHQTPEWGAHRAPECWLAAPRLLWLARLRPPALRAAADDCAPRERAAVDRPAVDRAAKRTCAAHIMRGAARVERRDPRAEGPAART